MEDINFLMSLIILFSTLDPEKDYYFYKIRYWKEDTTDFEYGKEILFTKFFDGATGLRWLATTRSDVAPVLHTRWQWRTLIQFPK